MPSNSQKSPSQPKDNTSSNMDDDTLYLDQRQTSDQVYELYQMYNGESDTFVKPKNNNFSRENRDRDT